MCDKRNKKKGKKKTWGTFPFLLIFFGWKNQCCVEKTSAFSTRKTFGRNKEKSKCSPGFVSHFFLFLSRPILVYVGWKKNAQGGEPRILTVKLRKNSGPFGQKLNTFGHDSEQGESFGDVYFRIKKSRKKNLGKFLLFPYFWNVCVSKTFNKHFKKHCHF